MNLFKSIFALSVSLILGTLYSTYACSNDTVQNTRTVKNESSIQIDTSKANYKKMELASMTFEDYALLNTKEKVYELFDSDQVRSGTYYFIEGGKAYDQSILTNPATTHQLSLVWDENGDLCFLQADYHKYDENYNELGIQMIESSCGLWLGMSLEKLTEWNGAEIEFHGFGWMGAGEILSQPNTKLDACNTRLILSTDQMTNDDIMGDKILSSKEEAVTSSEIYVSRLTMAFVNKKSY